jgi:hypothetical protein
VQRIVKPAPTITATVVPRETVAPMKAAAPHVPAPAPRTAEVPAPARKPIRSAAGGGSTLAFALAAARTLLTSAGGAVHETSEGVEFLHGETPYARLTTTPERIVVAFLAPRGIALSPRARFFKVADRSGWVRVEFPISRDPAPWLDADLGATIGQTLLELAQGADRSIVSAGGPYIVMPASEVAFWKPKTKLGKVADDVSIVTLPTCEVLALGSPDPLHWIPSANGGVLARVVSMAAEDSALVARHVASVSEARWEPRGTFHVRGTALLAFDSALMGLKLKLAEALQLGLTPARYAVSSATVVPDEDTELLLVRLAR